MPILTDEEADALDDLLTKTVPQTNPNVQGPFIKRRNTLVVVDDFSAAYLHARAEGTHKTPADIISELVREKVAAKA